MGTKHLCTTQMHDSHPDKIILPGHKDYVKEEDFDKSLILHEVEGQKYYISESDAIDIINKLSGALVVRGRSKH